MNPLFLSFALLLVVACSDYDDADIRNRSVGIYNGVRQSYEIQNNELMPAGPDENVTFSVYKVENPFHVGISIEGVDIIATQIAGAKNAYTFNVDEIVVNNQTFEGYAGCKNELGFFDGTYLTETQQFIFFVKRKDSSLVFRFVGTWVSAK
ncbi:MAG: hypothetical protein ACK57K_14840 [Chryseotalea sp.]|jgi:hypothetical protein|nr:hypothetical protein [Flammeovirgaceae bacterium]